jgi:hypothetical protein
MRLDAGIAEPAKLRRRQARDEAPPRSQRSQPFDASSGSTLHLNEDLTHDT